MWSMFMGFHYDELIKSCYGEHVWWSLKDFKEILSDDILVYALI